MSLHALVVGAGIGHMTTATALRRVGLDVTRIERVGRPCCMDPPVASETGPA